MLLSLFYSIAFFLQAILTPGANRVDGRHVKIIPAKISRIAFLDSLINESSALVRPDPEFDLYYTLNDSGGKPEVFAVNQKGHIVDVKPIPNAVNTDWEELVFYKDRAENPHLVIGDIGNNRSLRKNLCLYDYDVSSNKTIRHTLFYEDQTKFPPAEDSMNYDCEAFFRRDSSYYFISKNRGINTVKLYKLSQDTSIHKAHIQQTIVFKGMVNACSLIKDEKTGHEKLAVLLYGRIFLFNIVDSGKGIQLTAYGVIKFPGAGQSEGICWYNTTELRVTNEKGKLFKIVMK